MIKGVIFDMDGVLINSEDLYIEFECKFFRNLGADVSADYLERLKGTSANSMITYMYDNFNINSVPADFAQKMLEDGARLIYTDNPKLRLNTGVIDILNYFKENNIPMVIGSSTYTDGIECVLDRFNLRQYFKGYVGGNMVSKAKPDPEIFVKCTELLGLKPSECIVIEDSYNGIKAAKEAGCFCIGYLYDGKNKQDLSACDMVFDTFGKEKYYMLDKLLGFLNRAK